MSNPLTFSRPEAAARGLGGSAVDRHRFLDKRVLLTGEIPALRSENGRECLSTSLRLLVRICRDVTVAIPSGCDDAVDDLMQITSGRGASIPLIVGEQSGLENFDAILNVGCQSRIDLPWTVANSSGWVARVSSGSMSISDDYSRPNPMGAVAASCLGVTEVFKRLIGLKECRGQFTNALSWSLWTYAPHSDQGPDLPMSLPMDLLLVGAGAIGNGILHLLNSMPVCGNLSVVDPQCYGDENRGTCILVEECHVGHPKVDLAVQLLAGKLNVTPYREDVSTYRSRLGNSIPYPNTIVTGLDNVAARHFVQDLWPDLVIDGAIGDFACQVSRHGMNDHSACLRCMFREPPGEAADVLASRLTGLQRRRIAAAEELVGIEDINRAPESMQSWLRTRVGRTICSVVREAVAAAVATTPRQGFEPSVPFVACLSATMMMAELVKAVVGWSTTVDTRYQFDVLRGPQCGQMIPQGRRPECVCVARSSNIGQWRKNRNSRVT